ncbi:hypothetical protein IEQ34_010560 [Dendrobium chrysotoxum]|uniref:Uncharacterized protein n=1 Tax=Dendrobium chrysotoxum TaxID=161865 RepID=A0AAV7GTZ7_DENCH|nr:hypothetical protein IEQ34_010560 [Dendrobium chrysotoxum]
MKWRDFCEKKRVVHLFPKVLDWDDSAGKEAFDNAKARYWVQINNLPSKIPLLDPDMYVQEVDYDADIDPLLLEDLYNSPPPSPETPDLSSTKISEIMPTGWDVVDPPINTIPKYIFIKPSTADDIVDSSAPTIPTGCGDGGKIDITAESITIIPIGWGDEEKVEPINAQDFQGRQLNASTLNNTDKNGENMLGNTKNNRPSFELVPDWENRFCCQMKWRDFYEKKRVVHLLPKVLDWDDSVGKEAFDSAKARYWVQINNLPSKIPLIDLDIYVQEVDYDADIDPLLLENLYNSPPPSPETPDLSSIKISEITPTGWDVVDPPINTIPKYIFIKQSTADYIVDSSAPTIPTGCGDGGKIDITAE